MFWCLYFFNFYQILNPELSFICFCRHIQINLILRIVQEDRCYQIYYFYCEHFVLLIVNRSWSKVDWFWFPSRALFHIVLLITQKYLHMSLLYGGQIFRTWTLLHMVTNVFYMIWMKRGSIYPNLFMWF